MAECLRRGSGTHPYLPQLEPHHEARWWADARTAPWSGTSSAAPVPPGCGPIRWA
ncbi:hypothetical protein [Deinococcus hopiensis]|uniref:hypothetical protein n=1 Tax=Deinococcus hopiensis TaxID=309885 RepID=UPI003CCBD8EA